ncbi:unnamed protein product [Rotaria magnacalcarata]|nr:unnamed protein product [Rotaria magnacalcarata]CAF3216510.1 unnamed protein product [Rotaria socialis]CAF2120558.1 unnamed protein product [Rotaria magnacalcarata]CAF3495239.1 unnamed protein product [Rotaria socialis]CAF3597033.1 unnamed protein product [Rotaria socialis]
MESGNNSFKNLYSSTNEVQIIVAPSTSNTEEVASTSPSSTTPRTARDKFFKDVQYDKEKKRWSAECLLCETPKRVFDALGVTSNFNRHARDYHTQAFKLWLQELNEVKAMSSTNQKNKISQHFRKRNQASQHSAYHTTHPRQTELSTAIVNDLIIKLGLPLSIVERSAFINFMKTVDPKFSMTSRRTLNRTTIPSLYEKMHDRLKVFCSSATFLSLALDIWSDRRLRSFFAITGHAIVNGCFKSYVLGFVPLWGSHSGSLLLQKYEETINTFGIKHKVIRLVTDSSANNIHAFKDLVIPGFEHYFDKNDNDNMSDEDSDANSNDGTVSDEYEYLPNFCSTTPYSTTDTDALTQEFLIQDSFRSLLDHNEVFRIPCFAHTIQLVVSDGLKETKSVLSSLEKVSAIAKLSHTSTKFAEKLDAMNLSIPRAVITRWNSQFLTVERILAIPYIELNEILIELKHANLCLNTRDLVMLNEFVALLSLLAEVTITSQRENAPSISLVAPSILAIYFDLKNEKNNIQHTTALCDALISSLLSRFGGLLEQLEIDIRETGIEFEIKKQFYDLYRDPVFLFTPFLDGMFKLNWITQSYLPDSVKERICEKIKKLIFDQAVIIERANQSSVPDDLELIQEQLVQIVQSSSTSVLKRKGLFSNIRNDQKYPKKTKLNDSNIYIKEEISRYLNDINNDSMVLVRTTSSNPYTTLTKLATKYLCIPATTAAVERVFSQSGFLFRPHRARMTRKTLQQLTLLKCNCDIES